MSGEKNRLDSSASALVCGRVFYYVIDITQTKERKAILTSYPKGAQSPEQLRALIETSLDADKAEQIETIDLRGHSALADYMVIASGRSSRQVTALANKLRDRLKLSGVREVRVEGQAEGEWVIVDAGDIIIHLFKPEVREFYAIEKMWRIPTPGLELVHLHT